MIIQTSMLYIRPMSLVVIKINNKILVEQGFDSIDSFRFYRLPGGGINFGETSDECIKREIEEEFNLSLQKIDFLTIIENIFSFNGESKHELVFLYSADIKGNDIHEKNRIYRIDKPTSFAEWISIDEIKSGRIRIFPKEVINLL